MTSNAGDVAGAFHGGDIADAMAFSAHTERRPAPWLDLSTGINPHAYPLPDLPAEAWASLPGRRETQLLLEAACEYYSAPRPLHIVPGPGSQALIQALPHCLPDCPVCLISPTYSGHAMAWEAAGRPIRIIGSLEDADPSGITIAVNPNNPDGQSISREMLEVFAAQATLAGGWLVIDEAFCDLDPSLSVAAVADKHNLVVLRSFGKFFGLAGLRLGFAICPGEIATHLAEKLGPWAVSGPAIRIATLALADTAWQNRQRESLRKAAARLDELLTSHRLQVAGGTDLFRLVRTPVAAALFTHLLDHHIYVRKFTEHPQWLRVGIPGPEMEWNRLGAALSDHFS